VKTQTTFQNFDLNKIPEDLYIPKDAFKLTLESFSGPMDLLLYLIHKKDVDILDVNVAEITDQYVSYIDLMESLQIEIASDYLVMAATLAFIKSRMLLPTHEEDDVEDDPRSELIKRLQEYEKFKIASENIANLPRVDRDFFTASAALPEFSKNHKNSFIKNVDFAEIFSDINSRPKFDRSHKIEFLQLSTEDRVRKILEFLEKRNIIEFYKLFKKDEGKQGVVVSMLASLELAKEKKIEIIQNEDSNHFYIKSKKSLNG
tara:strand:+ start:187 stop:966 length:780 start_codon:yes stop_codon:yes gene_type:complete